MINKINSKMGTVASLKWQALHCFWLSDWQFSLGISAGEFSLDD